jgi:LPS sulfotransferase NodH
VFGGTQLFVVIGAQRTGTNLLREILNTHDKIAMLGEVLSPSDAPAHWDNFCRNLPPRAIHPTSVGQVAALLDQYFAFVRYRIRNHWEDNKKSSCAAFGVDIKYNQLRAITPLDWDSSHPFILSYLRSRRAILIHTTRNVLHSAISASIASKRGLWHNYDGVAIEGSYHIDVAECLVYAKSIIRERDAFIVSAGGSTIVDCRYEDLIADLAGAEPGEEIRDKLGPLKNIASALGCPFRFRRQERLQKAIKVPYSTLIVNYDFFVQRLKESEFSSLLPTLA